MHNRVFRTASPGSPQKASPPGHGERRRHKVSWANGSRRHNIAAGTLLVCAEGGRRHSFCPLAQHQLVGSPTTPSGGKNGGQLCRRHSFILYVPTACYASCFSRQPFPAPSLPSFLSRHDFPTLFSRPFSPAKYSRHFSPSSAYI